MVNLDFDSNKQLRWFQQNIVPVSSDRCAQIQLSQADSAALSPSNDIHLEDAVGPFDSTWKSNDLSIQREYHSCPQTLRLHPLLLKRLGDCNASAVVLLETNTTSFRNLGDL
jgi:hypothetical protein